MQCEQCSKQVPENSIVCPFCATPCGDARTSVSVPPPSEEQASPDEAITSLHTGDGPGGQAPSSAPVPGGVSPVDSGQHGRFLPGTTVAGRYRIVALLGRGGMGEVYRADDLKLGQQVALKFLPGRMVAEDDHVRRPVRRGADGTQGVAPECLPGSGTWGKPKGSTTCRWSTSTARIWPRCCAASDGCPRTRR